jgi:hypothetical protein
VSSLSLFALEPLSRSARQDEADSWLRAITATVKELTERRGRDYGEDADRAEREAGSSHYGAEAEHYQSSQDLFQTPGPVPFQIGSRDIPRGDPAFEKVEVLLDLAHQCSTRQSTKLNTVVELVGEESVASFEETYKDFQPLDLWFYSRDLEEIDRVSTSGMGSISPAMMARGVPVGMYRVEDEECDGPHQMILCKVALGRVRI